LPGYSTYKNFEESIWASEVYPEFKSGLGNYRFYIDTQGVLAITLQLAQTTPFEDAEITAIRIVPVGEKIFALGEAYMGNLICDFIYGNGAYKNSAIIQDFGKRIATQEMQFDVDGEGIYQVKLFATETAADKVGLHCDSPKAYDWDVPRAEEFLIDDIK